jgi:hypothetical protein
LSSHAVFSGRGWFTQPRLASQLSAVHSLLSLQSMAAPAAQRPAWQVSSLVHVLLSLQALPSRTRSETQPAVGPLATHVSVVHGLLSSQFGIGPATQAPARQLSVPLHGLASAQLVPSGASVRLHPPLAASHVSMVQGLLSLQLRGVPWHLPA